MIPQLSQWEINWAAPFLIKLFCLSIKTSKVYCQKLRRHQANPKKRKTTNFPCETIRVPINFLFRNIIFVAYFYRKILHVSYLGVLTLVGLLCRLLTAVNEKLFCLTLCISVSHSCPHKVSQYPGCVKQSYEVETLIALHQFTNQRGADFFNLTAQTH